MFYSNWPTNKWVAAGGKNQDHTSSMGSEQKNTQKHYGAIFPLIHILLAEMIMYPFLFDSNDTQ